MDIFESCVEKVATIFYPEFFSYDEDKRCRVVVKKVSPNFHIFITSQM